VWVGSSSFSTLQERLRQARAEKQAILGLRHSPAAAQPPITPAFDARTSEKLGSGGASLTDSDPSGSSRRATP